MIHAVASIIAVVFYLTASAYQGFYLLSRRHAPRRRRFMALAWLAIAAHGVSVAASIVTDHGIDFSIYRALSLTFWIVCLLGSLANLRRPLDNALALLFPLAAAAVVISLTLYGSATHQLEYSGGVLSHIVLSILAYSALTLAALQALVLALQERELKQRHLRGFLNGLPPLQTMETMLFELIWVGEVLLSLAIVSGLIYIDNVWAQHLVHKTVISIIAWLIFAGLLWGHHQLGWRGHTAVRWTLVGFSALVLAYFGTKIVLELILHRFA